MLTMSRYLSAAAQSFAARASSRLSLSSSTLSSLSLFLSAPFAFFGVPFFFDEAIDLSAAVSTTSLLAVFNFLAGGAVAAASFASPFSAASFARFSAANRRRLP